ncbi:MAG: tetratricopeptide repeat protein [Deltaproteobacteria bacterium]|nr:MAG: tetratricopeptide repeat protein [Deltaproteobacteria bacterium]
MARSHPLSRSLSCTSPRRPRAAVAGCSPRRRALAAAVFAACIAPAAAVANPRLDAAREALDALDFDAARTALDAALRTGDNDPAVVARIHGLAGQVAAAFGDVDGAAHHFRAWLSLAPGARLPPGLAPRFVDAFERARSELGGRALAIRVRPLRPGDTRVVAIVTADPARLVAGVRVRYRTAGGAVRVIEVLGDRRFSVPLGSVPAGPVHVAAIDRWGNRLAEAHQRVAPPVRRVPLRDAGARRRPLYARGGAWAIVAVGFGGAGAYYGLAARRDGDAIRAMLADPDRYDEDRARALRARGRRSALVANVNFGAAAAAAIVATVLWLRDDEPDEPRGVRIEPTAAGATVTWTARF